MVLISNNSIPEPCPGYAVLYNMSVFEETNFPLVLSSANARMSREFLDIMSNLEYKTRKTDLSRGEAQCSSCSRTPKAGSVCIPFHGGACVVVFSERFINLCDGILKASWTWQSGFNKEMLITFEKYNTKS